MVLYPGNLWFEFRVERRKKKPLHLFHPVWVPLSSTLADVHLCGVDTAWLWEATGDRVCVCVCVSGSDNSVSPG